MLGMITGDYKLVADYCNISLFEVREMQCVVYELMLRDAIISKWQESEQGQEVLKTLARITKTNADIDKIRSKINS